MSIIVFFVLMRGSHLLKIANAMPTGVCSLKHISSYLELKRELENLPGYSKQAAQLFMRYIIQFKKLTAIWKTRLINRETTFNIFDLVKIRESPSS